MATAPRPRDLLCKICDVRFGTVTERDQHVADGLHRESTERCIFCFFKCKRATDLRRHLRLVHRFIYEKEDPPPTYGAVPGLGPFIDPSRQDLTGSEFSRKNREMEKADHLAAHVEVNINRNRPVTSGDIIFSTRPLTVEQRKTVEMLVSMEDRVKERVYHQSTRMFARDINVRMSELWKGDIFYGEKINLRVHPESNPETEAVQEEVGTSPPIQTENPIVPTEDWESELQPDPTEEESLPLTFPVVEEYLPPDPPAGDESDQESVDSFVTCVEDQG